MFDSRLVLLQSVVDRIVPQSIKAVEPKNKFTRAIQHTYLLVSVDMAGLPGMAQVLAVFHTTFHTSDMVKCSHMEQRFVPPDSDCYLRLGFEAFYPQDRPPLLLPC